ncbi:MAG TPA: alpha/beta hydrolase [Pantanalinema sp.]
MPPFPEPRTPRPSFARPAGEAKLSLDPSSVDPLWISGGLLGAGLLFGWILQFLTPVCDRHPAIAVLLSGLNAVFAVATAVFAMKQGVRARAALGGATAVVLGACYVLWAQGAYRATLKGAPGYTLPHEELAYPISAKEVALTTADGVNLKATYMGRGAGIGVVLVPGWASDRKGFAIASLAQWLAPRFDVLVLDPRGTGDSGGKQTPDLKAKYDLLAAVAFLNARGANQVGVLAERESTLPAIVAVSEQKSIRSLALAAPTGHWGEAPVRGAWFQDPGNMLGRLYWRVGAGVRIAGGHGPETAELLPKAKGTPVLLLGSKEDPGGLLRQLHMVAPEPRGLRLFPGAGQPVAWEDFQAYYHTVAQWFGLTLSEEQSRAVVEPVLPSEEATDSVAMP